MRSITIFFACTLLSMHASSQRSKLDVVEIGIDQKSLNAVEWPFDVPFYLTGAVTDEVVSVTFNFRIADKPTRTKRWVSFPNPSYISTSTDPKIDGYLKDPKIWKRGLGDNTKFTLFCEGLHPNVKYNFRFELIRKVSLDTKLVSEMRTKLADHLKNFFRSKITTRIAACDLLAENAALTAIVYSYFSGKALRFKSNTAGSFSFNAFTLHPSANTAFVQSQNLFDATQNYNTAVTNLVLEFNNVKARILRDIDAIKTGKLKMNNYSKETLSLPFNPGLKEFKSYTILDGLNLLRQMSLASNKNLEEILKGSLRISNNDFSETAGQHHIESILFIASLLRELNAGLIKDTVSGTEAPRFNYFSSLLMTSLKETTGNIVKIYSARAELAKVEELLPDILSNIVQFDALEAEVLPTVDVVSEKTPYISAEAGIAYSVPFSAVTHFQGANIYAVPIDKRAPLSSFRGWNRVWKSLSLQIAVSNFFGDRPKNMQSVLGKSATTDLNLALGWRLNRIIKINAGLLPYKTNGKNILSEDYETKAATYFSIGLDINVLKAFGDVAKFLNL